MSNRPIVLNPACIKTLSAVEARPERSNQHEFNGVAALKDVLGTNRSELNVHFSVRGKTSALKLMLPGTMLVRTTLLAPSIVSTSKK